MTELEIQQQRPAFETHYGKRYPEVCAIFHRKFELDEFGIYTDGTVQVAFDIWCDLQPPKGSAVPIAWAFNRPGQPYHYFTTDPVKDNLNPDKLIPLFSHPLALRQPLKYAAICDIQQRWKNIKPKEVFWIIRDVERAHGIIAKSDAGIPVTEAGQRFPESREEKSQ